MTLARSLRVLCVLALAAAPAVGTASLVSTFDSGDEGWTVGSSQGSDGVTSLAWDASGGNPGGAITATDIGNEGGWWFVAPGAWAGDWTAYLGGTVAFGVFAMGGQDTKLNPPVEALVFVLADGGRLRAKDASGAVIGNWVTAEITLTADRFNLTNSAYTSFEEALAHVTGLVIPGDFVYKQQDKTWLDHVRVTAVPEPGTALLSLLGLTALGLVRRAAGTVPRRRG